MNKNINKFTNFKVLARLYLNSEKAKKQMQYNPIPYYDPYPAPVVVVRPKKTTSFVLFGPTGAGKSTFINAFAFILKGVQFRDLPYRPDPPEDDEMDESSTTDERSIGTPNGLAFLI